MASTPHYVRLAELDDLHFITACRQGVIHLTWERTTVRLTRDEFRRLVGLLDQAADPSGPAAVRDGALAVRCRPDEDSEFRLGSGVLLLAPLEFGRFVQLTREALQRLDELLASGAWDEADREEAPPNPLDQLRRVPFSRN